MSLRPSVLLLLTACVDYRVAGRAGPNEGTTDTGERDPEGLAEACNGQDDDGDGLVDEDWGDLDGDGVADCLDTTCEVEVAAARDASLSEDCLAAAGGVVDDPWNVVIEWQNFSIGDALMVPVVGNLTDDDGDGDADDDDDPDIVVVASPDAIDATLYVLDGATGVVTDARGGFHISGAIAIADVDADGASDVLALDTAGYVVALDGDLDVLWRSAVRSGEAHDHAPFIVGDLDADGIPEVIDRENVLDGATGALERRLAGAYGHSVGASVGDIDQDGLQEVIVPPNVFDSAGNLLWSSTTTASNTHWAMIVDADGDSEGEVVFVGNRRVAVYEHDGTLLTSWSTAPHSPGPPCAADFDGDGQVEISVPGSGVLSVRELDGTERWSARIDDTSGFGGCSGYDIDADGAYEVLLADEHRFYVFDGATGTARFVQEGHASATAYEYPTVADVDRDGSAEIVIVSNDWWSPGWSGVTVFGHATGEWLRSGTTWATHDFAVTNVEPDGSIPAVPEAPWLAHNVWRARPPVDERQDPAADLRVAITDVCVASCETGPVEIAWQVENVGPLDAPAGAMVVLFAMVGGAQVSLDARSLPEIPSGRALAGDVFTVIPADVPEGAYGVRVDATGRIDECREGNNVARGEGLCVTSPP